MQFSLTPDKEILKNPLHPPAVPSSEEDLGEVQQGKPHVTGAPAEVPWGSEPTSAPDLEEVAQK